MPFFSSLLLRIHAHLGAAQHILAYENLHCISLLGLSVLLKAILALGVEGQGGHAR